MAEGLFLKEGGKPTGFMHKIDAQRGEMIVGLSRMGQVPGVSGSGPLLRFHIRMKKTGVARLSLRNVELRDSRLRPIPVRTQDARITIENRAP